MYSLLLVDDEKLELETLRDYIGRAWELQPYIRREVEKRHIRKYGVCSRIL